MVGSNGKRVAAWLTLALVASFSIGVVAPASAAEREQRNDSIFIKSDKDFTKANGVRSGSGTASDPYVISGWDVFDVFIRDTGAHLVIRDNTIDFLTLNWNGPGVTVVNNDIGDLRVNENVKRTGEPTSGLIAHNTFDVVGQLRHFDGEFTNNTVGSPTPEAWDSLPFFDHRAVNFDGFNGSHFYENTIFGYVEVRLHGHHHGSGYGEQSHYHGAAPEQHDGAHASHSDMVDHGQRYHQVWVHDNTIHADGSYALIYTDSNHQGNDRTARSETNKDLNKPHTHYTKVHLTDNKLVGAGLVVNIFNAKDERHTETNRGLMDIARNKISLSRDMQTTQSSWWPFENRDGIAVWNAKDVKLQIVGNAITYDGSEDPLAVTDYEHGDAGIRLQTVDLADVLIAQNSVANTYYGVAASRMTDKVFWTVRGLVTDGVTEPVYYDNSVKNEPQDGP
jgi:hypothetical protein